jgi:ribosomal protein S18 acetylase RimI-like enzyme
MESSALLNLLKQNVNQNAWPICDVTQWPERSRVFTHEAGGKAAYLIVSGHPACRDCPAVIIGGDAEAVPPLLKHLPERPYIIRETPASLLEALKPACTNSTVYREQRMEVSRSTFRKKDKGAARRLTPDDAVAMADFHGAPPQAAQEFSHWLRGGKVYGVFAGEKLAAIASTMVELPEVWVLVSIRTREELRRKGYGREATSALTAKALESVPIVSLTVKKDNAPAIGLYSQLGYQVKEDRLWIDCGAGSEP